MIRLFRATLLLTLASLARRPTAPEHERGRPASRRIVIFKIDGLNADLLHRTMRETDPETGKSRLPWFSHIFAEHGTVFENFYTRGISLSAPSWSMLDTGHHTIIRGNVEYDRYTGYVYDYLNFFPFYIGYARKHQVDMPGVEVLDRAGIPLVIDAFPVPPSLSKLPAFSTRRSLDHLGARSRTPLLFKDPALRHRKCRRSLSRPNARTANGRRTQGLI